MSEIKTYNDLMEIGENEADRMAFIEAAVREHKTSEAYRIARDAVEYERQRNVTINRYRKLLYDLRGNAVEDRFSAYV